MIKKTISLRGLQSILNERELKNVLGGSGGFGDGHCMITDYMYKPGGCVIDGSICWIKDENSIYDVYGQCRSVCIDPWENLYDCECRVS